MRHKALQRRADAPQPYWRIGCRRRARSRVVTVTNSEGPAGRRTSAAIGNRGAAAAGHDRDLERQPGSRGGPGGTSYGQSRVRLGVHVVSVSRKT